MRGIIRDSEQGDVSYDAPPPVTRDLDFFVSYDAPPPVTRDLGFCVSYEAPPPVTS